MSVSAGDSKRSMPGVRRVVASALGCVALVALSGCAETTLASQPPPPTTVAPTTTLPPVTTVAPTTTTFTPSTTSTTPTTSTTTTVVTVPAPTEPIEAVGRSNGEATKRAQERLLELGFWLKEADGKYGLTTRQAVMAFQKYHGLERDASIGPETAEKLSTVTERPKGRTDVGTLVEIDKKKQLMFFLQDGRVEWVINVSTGSGRSYDYEDKKNPGQRLTGTSITRNGLHSVYRQYGAGWWDGQLGKIYRPKYISGGIAIHGYTSIPAYPASHGCVRVSLPAMDFIWDAEIAPRDTPVWVHAGKHEPEPEPDDS